AGAGPDHRVHDAGRPVDTARRVLRHARGNPGSPGPDPRGRGLVHQGLEQVAHAPRAQLPHGPTSFFRPRPRGQGPGLPLAGLLRPGEALPGDGRGGRLADGAVAGPLTEAGRAPARIHGTAAAGTWFRRRPSRAPRAARWSLDTAGGPVLKSGSGRDLDPD